MLRSRVLRAFGAVVLVVVGSGFALLGAALLPSVRGAAFLLVALALLVGAVGGVARLVVDARPAAAPPEPGLYDGEPALVLARDSRPTQVSSWALAGIGAALLGGAVLGALVGSWVVVLLLGLSGGFCVWSASPHRRDLAGGLWLTPTRVVHAYRGRRWALAWDDLRDVVDTPAGPRGMGRLLLLTVPDATRDERRYGPPGRAWREGVRLDDRGPLGPGGDSAGVLGLEVEGLALSPCELADLLRRAATDPGFRAGLGRA